MWNINRRRRRRTEEEGKREDENRIKMKQNKKWEKAGNNNNNNKRNLLQYFHIFVCSGNHSSETVYLLQVYLLWLVCKVTESSYTALANFSLRHFLIAYHHWISVSSVCCVRPSLFVLRPFYFIVVYITSVHNRLESFALLFPPR
jgi:hypothetical protein